MSKKKLPAYLQPGYEMPEDHDALMKEYRKIAKAADMRLVRLEKISTTDNFKNADKWSYARAERDIKEWGGPEATRFNIKPPKGDANVRAKIEDMLTFMRAQTSTKTGIKSVHQKRAETINKEYGTNFTWEDLAKFYKSDLAKKMDESLGSPVKMKVLAEIRKKKKDIKKAIEENREKDLRVPDNMVGELVKDTVKKYGADVLEYLVGE